MPEISPAEEQATLKPSKLMEPSVSGKMLFPLTYKVEL